MSDKLVEEAGEFVFRCRVANELDKKTYETLAIIFVEDIFLVQGFVPYLLSCSIVSEEALPEDFICAYRCRQSIRSNMA